MKNIYQDEGQDIQIFNPYSVAIFCPECVVSFLCLLHMFRCISNYSGSVVEYLTRDQGVAGWNLTGITLLCP